MNAVVTNETFNLYSVNKLLLYLVFFVAICYVDHKV